MTMDRLFGHRRPALRRGISFGCETHFRSLHNRRGPTDRTKQCDRLMAALKGQNTVFFRIFLRIACEGIVKNSTFLYRANFFYLYDCFFFSPYEDKQIYFLGTRNANEVQQRDHSKPKQITIFRSNFMAKTNNRKQ